MAPIHDAVYRGDVEAVRRELAAGVSPDLIEQNNSPLKMAADWQRLEITLILIEAGADVDQVVGIFTPLHVACVHGCKATVAALLAAGASTSLLRETPGLKQRPVEMIRVGHKHILPMLLRAGSPLPRWTIAEWMQPDNSDEDADAFNAAATNYVNAVFAAGGYVPYERAHRQRLTAIFVPKFTWLPAEVVPTIVEFWAHVGHY